MWRLLNDLNQLSLELELELELERERERELELELELERELEREGFQSNFLSLSPLSSCSLLSL
ncbi:MAG: hypothetical protein V9G20_03930 [Candidatus Promineifilaceae bacterium]